MKVLFKKGFFLFLTANPEASGAKFFRKVHKAFFIENVLIPFP